MNDMNQFVDLELQSEVAHLRADNNRLQRRLEISDICLTQVLDDVANGSFFHKEELVVLRRLTSGYQVSKEDQLVLDKLNAKETDEEVYDFSDVVAGAYDGSSTDANT